MKNKCLKSYEKWSICTVLRVISNIQAKYPQEQTPIRTALITARNSPAHERVIRTLSQWGVRLDEAFFLWSW